MKVQEDYGKLAIKGSLITFESDFYSSWIFKISDILIIGEFTNQDGPHLEDHFLLFINKTGNSFEAPVNAKGFNSVWNHLADILNLPKGLYLQGETDFASQVLYPESIRGQPIFDYVDKSSSSFFGRIFSVLGGGEIESHFTNNIKKYVS